MIGSNLQFAINLIIKITAQVLRKQIVHITIIAKAKTAINLFFCKKEVDVGCPQGHQPSKTYNYPCEKNFYKNYNKLQFSQHFENTNCFEKTCQKVKNKRRKRKSCPNCNHYKVVKVVAVVNMGINNPL